MGICPARSVPTFVAKNASVFQGSRYPLKPKHTTRTSSTIPLSHVSSLGFRYAFRKNTLNICANAVKTIRLALQEWIERTSHPNCTCVIRYCTLSKASSGVGR